MREHRLTRRPEFVAIYARGRRFFSKHFILFALRHSSPPEKAGQPWRMGLAVTRKAGNAVERNRIKRVVREFFRLHGGMLPQNVDVVVVPRRGLDPSRLSLGLVERDLTPALEQALKQLAPGS